MNEMQKTRHLALMGGVGPGASAHYYMRLSAETRRRNLALELTMPNAEVEEVQVYLRGEDPQGMAKYFAARLDRAKAAGAVVGVLPSVACHFCCDALDAVAPIPMINLLTAVREDALRRGIKRAVLFGTKYAMGSKLFGRLPEIDWVDPRPEEFNAIHDMYEAIVRAGKGTREQHDAFTKIARRIVQEDGAECVFFAGTDLTLVFNEANTDFPHLDCAEVHIQSILKEILPIG